jgi:hypothetical protein
MNFGEKFKIGDIICSKHFINNKCMVVREIKTNHRGEEAVYMCDDLVIENQRWVAKERDSYFNEEYNWQLATDDQIIEYLSRFIEVDLGKIGDKYIAKYRDDGIYFQSTYISEEDFSLELNDLIGLKNILEDRLTNEKTNTSSF